MVLEIFHHIAVRLEQDIGSPNEIRATVYSDDSGYTIYANGMGDYPAYVHNSKVDGNTTYGSIYCSFIRRNMSGGCWKNNTICGSRSVYAYNSTARTVSWCSMRYGQRLVVKTVGIF